MNFAAFILQDKPGRFSGGMSYKKGLTQKDLGKLCGLTQSSIARLENGTLSPSISTVTRVLSTLGKRLYVGNLT